MADRVAGLRDLSAMLAGLDPELLPGEFVFCSLPSASLADAVMLDPVGVFSESEGLTVILRRETAETHGLAFDLVLRCVTLHLHSDLAAVGLTAAFATRLAEVGISANVIAGFYHDHLFVPKADAERAMQALRGLQAEAIQSRGKSSTTVV